MIDTQTRTLHLPCPLCGEERASLDLHFDSGELTCQDCDGQFHPDLIRKILASKWAKAIAWLDAMPDDGDDD